MSVPSHAAIRRDEREGGEGFEMMGGGSACGASKVAFGARGDNSVSSMCNVYGKNDKMVGCRPSNPIITVQKEE